MGSIPPEDFLKWRDVTVPVAADTPVWPGDPAPVITAIARHEDGDGVQLTEAFFGLHTGTHIDAPLHFIPGGADILNLNAQALTGPVWVIDATSVERISAEWLNEHLPKEADRILLKTIPDHADRRAAITRPDPVGLDESAARVLVSQNVLLVGIDGLSIAVVDRLTAVHVLLLEKSIVIVEHLDLNGVDPGSYEMMALPMSIAGAEAAPARVLIRPLPLA